MQHLQVYYRAKLRQLQAGSVQIIIAESKCDTQCI